MEMIIHYLYTSPELTSEILPRMRVLCHLGENSLRSPRAQQGVSADRGRLVTAAALRTFLCRTGFDIHPLSR
jgi:hypothetical protein